MADREDTRAVSDQARQGTASQRMGKFVSTLTTAVIPPEVVEAAKLHALDTVGVGIAAAVLSGEAKSARAAATVMTGMEGQRQASVVGHEVRVPAPNAGWANAALQHSLDFDDNHTASRVHVSTMIVPASMAVGEQVGASGSDVVAALVAGNEIATRIGMGGPTHFQAHGFHGTPVCGVFGAAAAASTLLGLNDDRTAHAFGLAGDAASGPNAWVVEGNTNKHLHPGWAVHGGILAALLAQAGADGPPGVFEGRFGLYEALAGATDVDLEPVLGTLGVVWETPQMAYKPYPACHFTHASIDSAADIREDVLDSFDQIESIDVVVPTVAVPIVLEPRGNRVNPRTPYAGKFSLQYCVAAMLLRGQVDLNTFTVASMADQEVLELAARIGYLVSDVFDAGEQVYPGGVLVRMRDGRELAAEVPEPRGTTRNPMPDSQIVEKFRSNAGYGLAGDDVDLLVEQFLGLEDLPDLSVIAGALRRVKAR